MKRKLIVAAVIIVLLGVGVAVYFFFFAKAGGLVVAPTNSFPTSGDGTVDQPSSSVTQELGVPRAGAGTEVAPRLIRISDAPVAVGAVATFVPGKVATSSVGTSTTATTAFSVDPDVRVSYIERESGNVYAFLSRARTLTRISNKTLPGVQEAVWTPDGSQAFVRFLEKVGADERVSTFALPSNGEGGYLLENNLAQVLVTGSSTLVTLLPFSNGSTASISSVVGTGVRTLFESSLSAVRLSIGGGSTLATTKAGVKSPGYTFLVDTKSGSFTRVLGPLNGLSAQVSPSGRYILYSYLDRGKVSLGVFDIVGRSAVRLPLATLAEKCAWSSDSLSIYCGVPTTIVGAYPDDWYQGTTQSSDRLWRIEITNRVATQLIDPKTAGGVDIDAIALTVDKAGDVLVFTNKRDKTLWLYDL